MISATRRRNISYVDQLVALAAVLMLVFDVLLYSFAESYQTRDGYSWLPWLLLAAATSCSLVFKLSAD